VKVEKHPVTSFGIKAEATFRAGPSVRTGKGDQGVKSEPQEQEEDSFNWGKPETQRDIHTVFARC